MEGNNDSEETDSKEYEVILKDRYVLFLEYFSGNRKSKNVREDTLKEVASHFEKPVGKIGIIGIYEISSNKATLEIFSRKLYRENAKKLAETFSTLENSFKLFSPYYGEDTKSFKKIAEIDYTCSILPMLFQVDIECAKRLLKEVTIKNYKNYPDCGLRESL